MKPKTLLELVAGGTFRRDRHAELLLGDLSIGKALDRVDRGALELDEDVYERLDWCQYYAWQYRERLMNEEIALELFVGAMNGDHPPGRVPLELVRSELIS
jgi:hypothetical protein